MLNVFLWYCIRDCLFVLKLFSLAFYCLKLQIDSAADGKVIKVAFQCLLHLAETCNPNSFSQMCEKLISSGFISFCLQLKVTHRYQVIVFRPICIFQDSITLH